MGLHRLIDIATRLGTFSRKAAALVAAKGNGVAFWPFKRRDLDHAPVCQKLLPFIGHDKQSFGRQRLIGRGTKTLLGQRLLAGVIDTRQSGRGAATAASSTVWLRLMTASGR